MKPLFKWTGGKGRLLSKKYKDLNFFPEASKFNTFVDLFGGAGAVTLAVAEQYPDCHLIFNDLNEELLQLYFQIRNNWDNFKDEYQRSVERFLTCEDRRENYFATRDIHVKHYKETSEVVLAANLLCMMKTNFNGIWLSYKNFGYRYSTAFGKEEYKPSLFDLEKVEQFRDVLKRAKVYNLSYKDVPIPVNSWVYADPPYRDSKQMYKNIFSDEEQIELCNFLKKGDNLYALSNKDLGDGFWKKQFPEENISYLDHKFTCGYGDSINHVTEVLIKNYQNFPQATLPL